MYRKAGCWEFEALAFKPGKDKTPILEKYQ